MSDNWVLTGGGDGLGGALLPGRADRWLWAPGDSHGEKNPFPGDNISLHPTGLYPYPVTCGNQWINQVLHARCIRKGPSVNAAS